MGVFQGAVCFLILFVLVDAILLNLDLQRGTSCKGFFWVSSLFSNNFAPHVRDLETCFAILVYFDFGYVWDAMWLFKLPFFENFVEQMSHLYFFPSCMDAMCFPKPLFS